MKKITLRVIIWIIWLAENGLDASIWPYSESFL